MRSRKSDNCREAQGDEIDFFMLIRTNKSCRPLTVVKSISALFIVHDNAVPNSCFATLWGTAGGGKEEEKPLKDTILNKKFASVPDQFECKCATINNMMLSPFICSTESPYVVAGVLRSNHRKYLLTFHSPEKKINCFCCYRQLIVGRVENCE